MFHSSSPLLVSLAFLPVLLAQQNSTNSSTNPTTGTSQNATSPTDTTAASSSSFTPLAFSPTLATGTTCGSTQQNFNQCITKVSKDINSCTNNVCLCQTLANYAACHNGCSALVDQGKQYQAQSTQYCTLAGVKPNTTADATPTTVSTSNNTSTLPITSSPNNSNSSTTNASTFSAAKGAASFGVSFSSSPAIGAFVASIAVLFM